MAEWWRRLVAFGIDLAVLAIPNSVIASAIAGSASASTRATNLAAVDPRVWEAIGLALVVSLGYFSVGKRVLGIAVRDIDTGGPVGAGRALARRLIFFAMYLGFGVLFLVNGLSPLWDPRRQAWHDKIVGSCVVSMR